VKLKDFLFLFSLKKVFYRLIFIKELEIINSNIILGNKPKNIVINTKGKNAWNSNSNISLEYFKWFDKVPKYILL